MTQQDAANILARLERVARAELVQTGQLPDFIIVPAEDYDQLLTKTIVIRGRVIRLEKQNG